MTFGKTVFGAAVWTCFLVPIAGAQSPLKSTEVAAPATSLPKGVACTVNGRAITQREVAETVDAVLAERTQGQSIPPKMLAQLRERLLPEVMAGLIADELLNEDADKAKINVTNEDLSQEMEKVVRSHLVRSGMSRSEFEAQIQSNLGISLEKFMKRQTSDPRFRQAYRHTKLLEKQYPSELAVTEQEVQARYATDRDSVYSRPEVVQASHILFGTEAGASADEKAVSRKKAETVLKTAKAPDANFAELAKLHSTGPSNERGGDLGYFPREGRMAEPFAAAAFAMKPGDVSEIIETQFGYHIILVTDRKEPMVVTLADAEETIREQLKAERMVEVRQRHIDMLKGSAKIEYPK